MIVNGRGQKRPEKYRKHFERDASERVEITERDLEIFRALEIHRFLTTSHIMALTGSTLKLRYRLNALSKAGFIDRPKRQQVRFHKGGRRELVYALSSRGARALREVRAGGAMRDWGYQNNEVQTEFIDHSLAVAEFLVAAECVLRVNPDWGLVMPHELIAHAPSSTRARKPHVVTKWAAKIDWDGNGRHEEMAAVPDAIFAIARRDGGKVINCVLEIDTGSMPVVRSERKLSSIKRKVAVYHKAYRDNYHERTFGWKGCRFLFVTSTRERAESIRACIANVTEGKNANAFWVIDWETLKAGTLLDVMWTLGSGTTDMLIK